MPSREHERIVTGLLRYMVNVGTTIWGADAPGWPGAPRVGRRRPDILGYYRPGAALAAGEAKRGPELWGCATQIEDLAQALGSMRVGGAVLFLGVGPGWAAEAKALIDCIDTGKTSILVCSADGR